MRRSSCTVMMLVLACSSFLPAPARAENDSRSITQRITELRTRLDSFCGNPARNDTQTLQKSAESASGKASSGANAAQKGSAIGANSSEKMTEKSIDGEKFVLLPTDAAGKSSQSVSPEGESAAIEHNQNVKMTVLFHDGDTTGQSDKRIAPEANAKNADATAAVAKKP